MSFVKYLLEKKCNEYICSSSDYPKGMSENNKEQYQAMFRKMLGKYGVDSPAKMDTETKKKFFDEIDSAWKHESMHSKKMNEMSKMEKMGEMSDSDYKRMKESCESMKYKLHEYCKMSESVPSLCEKMKKAHEMVESACNNELK